MPICTMRDGVELFYQDWGSGRPVVFIHGWPLNGDAWADQMKAVSDAGYRAVRGSRPGGTRLDGPWPAT